MLTPHATLAIFTIFCLSSFAVFWAKKLHMPQTVFLVLLGIGLGLLAHIPAFTFLNAFQLTPELLFYLLLPTLIFESAYNINVRRIVEDTVPIMLLAIVSLLISSFTIATVLYFVLPLLHINAPFIVTFLFGSLISATDPVAVLALFKEFGAPRRLSLIFEGESLFNDATAVALFLVTLNIIVNGFFGIETVATGVLTFFSMMMLGVLFGLCMGGLFAKLVGITRESEVASITLTIVLAHITFILSEIISESVHIGTFHVMVSPIIATTVASLVMGNYGRAKIHPRAEAFVEKLWEQLAFMANSLIFILIGILFVQASVFETDILIVTVITVLIVALARALSIYPVITGYNFFAAVGRQLPIAWQHLLSWGSLRGALAVTMVLLIPDTLTMPGWEASLSIKEFLLAITVGCIFTTLFLKATTIGKFMQWLKLDGMTDVEAVEYQEAKALMHHEVSDRLSRYTKRGYISEDAARRLSTEHDRCYNDACQTILNLSSDTKTKLVHRTLRIFAIGIEKRHLHDLYHHHEVNEAVFRRLRGKLQIQLEEIEFGNLAPNVSLHTDAKDVFEKIAAFLRTLFTDTTATQRITNLYMYYRAQVILSRKVLKEIGNIDNLYAQNIFTPEALEHTVTLYTNFKNQSEQKMHHLHQLHPGIITPLTEDLAHRGVIKIEENLLTSLFERELITPKLHVTLKNELRKH